MEAIRRSFGPFTPSKRRPPRFPSATLPGPVSMEVLVTDSPASQRDDRTILDRTDLPLHRMNTWSTADLVGERPEHRFLVAMTHRGWFNELQVRVVLHGRLRNVIRRRTRADFKVERIWLSRNYVYGDSARMCFAASRPPEQFEGRIWLATVPKDAAKIGEVSERSFDYGTALEGRVDFDLHGGYSYALDWEAHRDRKGRNYRAQWFKGDELIDEAVESVFRMREAEAAGCGAFASGSYCDTDDI